MLGLIDQIIWTLNTQPLASAIDEAIRNAAYVFEKARGLSPAGMGWPDEIINSIFTDADVKRLKDSLIQFIEKGGKGSWALGKSHDPTLKWTYILVLRREMDADTDELFQAIIALQNIGECFFSEVGGFSILEKEINQSGAKHYLDSLQ
ncbi:MAG TPA: hypothetical protein VIM11_09875 [Tepidisphaeraceae bacterium]|jgi:hypothetical protein